MAQLAYKGFEALAAGAVDTDFTAVSGTWGALKSRQTGGSTGYGINATINTGNADAKFLLLTSIGGVPITPQADMSVQFGLQTGRTGGTLNYNLSALARCNLAGTEYVQAFYSPTNDQIQVYYKTAAGAVTQIGTNTAAGLSTGNNEPILCKLEVQGTAVRFKVWKQGAAEPGSFQFVGAQSAVTAAGYPGVRTGYATGALAPTFDDFYYGDAGETYALPASADLAVTDAKAYKSHRNFRAKGTGLRTNNSGAEISIKVTGTTSLALVNDMANAATTNPIRVSQDGGAYQSLSMFPWDILASNLNPATTYEFRIWVPLLTQSGDKWTGSATNVWDPLRFVADSGATYVAHTRTGPWGLFYFDSLGEYTDALAMLGYNLATALGIERGLVAYGGTGIGTNNGSGTAVGQVPALSSRYNLLDSATSVDTTDVPALIAIVMGTNDQLAGASSATTQAAIATINTGLRAMYGSTVPIFFCVPVGGQSRSAITAGQAALGDPNTKLVDSGTLPNAATTSATDVTFDGVHLNNYGVAQGVGMLATNIKKALAKFPAANTVKTGTGTYGFSESPLTPSLTITFPTASQILTGGVASDGTTTVNGNVSLPAASNVLNTAPPYGPATAPINGSATQSGGGGEAVSANFRLGF